MAQLSTKNIVKYDAFMALNSNIVKAKIKSNKRTVRVFLTALKLIEKKGKSLGDIHQNKGKNNLVLLPFMPAQCSTAINSKQPVEY